LPLPTGRVIQSDHTMTAAEMSQARAFQRQSQLPPDIAELAQAVDEEARSYLPPCDENTPPLQVETVDIEQLSPQEQARVRRNIAEALSSAPAPQRPPAPAQQRQAPPPVRRRPPDTSTVLQQPAAAEEDVTVGSQAIPGWRNPNNPGYQPIQPNVRLQQAAATAPPPADELEVEMDLPPRQQTIVPTLPPEPEPEPEIPEASAFADDEPEKCDHCGWRRGMPDIPEPEYGEKMAFLQSVLGQKPFIKDYPLMGGQLHVRFRTLTTREIDLIYKQVLREKERGQIPSYEDHVERINRYRLYLQIIQVTGPGLHKELPDGYDKESNPYAEAVYKFDPPADPRETALPQIEAYLADEILRTEVLHRMMQTQCARFNRLVSKMEAMVDNSDFWQPTEGQS
jgi:hypothetical protein